MTHPTPAQRTVALLYATRFAAILSDLLLTIGREFGKNPFNHPFDTPLRRLITRTTRRFTALMALLAQGRLPRIHPKRPGRPARPATPRPRLPRQSAWLIDALRHHAAVYRSHLEQLFNEPDLQALLAPVQDHADRLLSPLRHVLGLPPHDPQQDPAPRPRRPWPAIPPPPIAPEVARLYEYFSGLQQKLADRLR